MRVSDESTSCVDGEGGSLFNNDPCVMDACINIYQYCVIIKYKFKK